MKCPGLKLEYLKLCVHLTDLNIYRRQKLNGETSDLLNKIVVLFFIISNKKNNETSSLYIIIQQIGCLQ